MSEYGVYVVSARRPDCVPEMVRVLSPDHLTFAVPREDADSYLRAVSELADPSVAEVLPLGNQGLDRPLPAHRNAAVDHAQERGRSCFQLSDDLISLGHLNKEGKRTATSWSKVRDVMLRGLNRAHLVGVPPTANPFYASDKVNPWAFVIGDLHLTSSTTPVRHSLDIPLKEDYDLTCKHLIEYGQVARLDFILAEFRHYSNAGGAVSYRNDELEHQVTSRLLSRYPDLLRPHTSRQHELLLKRRPY